MSLICAISAKDFLAETGGVTGRTTELAGVDIAEADVTEAEFAEAEFAGAEDLEDISLRLIFSIFEIFEFNFYPQLSRGMENRFRRNMTRKRCALRGGSYNSSVLQPGGFMNPMRGGAFSTNTTPLVHTTGVTAPREVIQGLRDIGSAYPRDGMLVNQPNPALAQVAMAGGGFSAPLRNRSPRSQIMSDSRSSYGMAGGARRRRLDRLRRRMHGGGCGCSGQRGGALSYAPVGSMSNLMYGISGKGGYETNPGVSVGGAGPNVGAEIDRNGCYPSIRSGMVGGTRRRQRGGGGSTYVGPGCYTAPGSLLPVYPNPSAGFNQTPSTWSLPQGVANAFQIYNPVVARVGGARKTKKRSYRR